MEYFSIIIQFDLKTITENFVKSFYSLLRGLGFSLEKGFWKADGMTVEQIISTQQQYLSEGKIEDRYKYNLIEDGFKYNGIFIFRKFSEIRGFWDINNEIVSFHILFPETDFFYDGEGKTKRNIDKMNSLRDLSERIWENTQSEIIQTMWECSDVPPDYCEINLRNQPQVEPFAIVPYSKYETEWFFNNKAIDRNGIVLEDPENWLPL